RAALPGSPPAEVRRLWAQLRKSSHLELGEVSGSTLCRTLVQLCAVADEACQGVGYQPPEDGGDFFDFVASRELLPDPEAGSTLCQAVHVSRVRVLPKCHTPQTGITLDSLFHNLTLWPAVDVQPHWITPQHRGLDNVEHRLNLLLVPWPEKVSPMQFAAASPRSGELANMPAKFGFFSYTKKSDPDGLKARLDDVYQRALELAGRIELVVLPELALDLAEYEAVRGWAQDRKLLLLCGVGEPSAGATPGKNYVALEVLLSGEHSVQVRQYKHHRWQLDKRQIVQYGLGGQLDPEGRWWEHTSAQARRLTFVSLLDWLSFCFLVCEDLARQEPVARLVRSVGPNLVIALLMDGPQLPGRWPDRYATVLADDPGSSVLTLTSIGMAELCRPPGVTPSRAVALWKDAKSGAARAIELPVGADGLVLNLTRLREEEWSADGRSDGGVAGYPILAGVHPVWAGPAPRKS
ncbi:MAG TPA: hypothetical protein VOA87_05520, partial [Thermoanaerobaculia bacterium]|nr:hypothetical protein [Thermoanaerobaculia bacterium]